MPEILEIELYRRAAARALPGVTIAAVDCPDPTWVAEPGPQRLAEALTGATVRTVDRWGKLLLVDTTNGVLGLRFGMTGRLVINDLPVIETLEYSSRRLDESWNRFGLRCDGGTTVVVNDPRRLGRAELDPTPRLGIDAFDVTAADLALALRGRRAVKAVLLDQKRVAGLGNLLADEALWLAGIDPGRAASTLSEDEVAGLALAIPPMLERLLRRGGSTSGDFFEARKEGAQCPLDGAPVVCGVFGGRRTWWCPQHQR